MKKKVEKYLSSIIFNMSIFKTIATIHYTTAVLLGGFANWAARQEIKEDLQLYKKDPLEKSIFYKSAKYKYAQYNIRNLSDLQKKPSVQRRYVYDCTLRAAGSALMWPIISFQ